MRSPFLALARSEARGRAPGLRGGWHAPGGPVAPGVSNRRRTLGVGDVVGGRFRLEAELGEGGMSRVYEAVDLKYQRAAAVKVLARWLAEDEEFRHRFERESVAAERVTHPHVLPIWDHGDEKGLLFLATPLCDLDLGDLISDRGRLDIDRALIIIAQVAWALDWAHGRGVVHRDVKPENVLLVSGPDSEHAYLADFGLARARVDDTLTQAGHPPGLTPAYAAPEQWRGEAIGPAADQYAVAARGPPQRFAARSRRRRRGCPRGAGRGGRARPGQGAQPALRDVPRARR